MLNVLEISLRADFGGGPEHMYRLMQNLSPEINLFAAAPLDYPYWDRFKTITGDKAIFELPHRNFKIARLLGLYSFCRKNSIHLIHAHGKGASMYARPLGLLLGLPVIYTFHGIHVGRYGRLKKALYLLIEKILSRFTSAFISVSASEFEQVKKAGFCPMKKVHIINNGVYIPEIEKPDSTDDENDFNVIMASRFDYQKNTMAALEIIKALRRYPCYQKIKLIIAGGGEEKEEFEKRVKAENMEEKIILTGFQSDMTPIFKRGSVYLSTSRWEGLPLAVLEAMAYGLPAILSNVTGNKDLIDDGIDGYLYGLDEPEKAAEYIANLYLDIELRKKMSVAAAEKIKLKFSVQNMAAQTEVLYKILTLK